ncbi:MAG: helix-turn-helix domain-containing protein [Candidatus Daviesbacteria bacterium]|nr:helix-turn-helix domain-containing protein [Candidatus Daviesbacteria bacterium]
MRTVGQILREEREAKFYTLEDVEKNIKIRKEILIALEADNYQKLPPPTFVQGFIKNYAKFLGLDREKLLAIYRREFSSQKNKPHIMETFANPVKETKFSITPGRVLGLVIGVLVLSFFIYLWFQFHQFIGPPTLSLNSPQDQYTTDNALISIAGKTDPEMKILINGQNVAVDTNGKFKEEITLSSEVNKISVTAISKFGQKVTLDRVVYLKR